MNKCALKYQKRSKRTVFKAEGINSLGGKDDIGTSLEDELDSLLDDVSLSVANGLKLSSVLGVQHNTHGHLVLVEVEV